MPTTEITDNSRGMALTMPLPTLATRPGPLAASDSPTSSIFTMSATTP